MKILYVTTRPPYPPHKGDQLIAYEQIRNLSSKNIELTLVSLIKDESEKTPVIAELSRYCKEIHFIKLNKAVSVLAVLKTFLNWKPIQVNMHTTKLIAHKLRKIISSTQPDLIHIQTVRLAELVAKEKTCKVLDMIDILSLNMERRAHKETFLKKQVFQLESFLLKKYEKKAVQNHQKVSIVSENDLLHSHLKNEEAIDVNPNGTSFIKRIPDKSNPIMKENMMIFHGNMGYFPNVEATLSFIQEVWPAVHEKYPAYQLYIVGKDPVDKILKYNGKDNIVVTGFVEDISHYLRRAKIGIYPLNSGTGMQNKILEALACGLPTIASSFAIQGIKGITSEELFIANKKEEYLYAIDSLFADDLLLESYEKNGRNFIRKHYSWNRNTETLMNMWEDALYSREYSNNHILNESAANHK